MQTCETCRHWGETGVVQAQPVPALPDGECRIEDARVAAIGCGYGSDGGAILVTRADFGCVCHEPKGE